MAGVILGGIAVLRHALQPLRITNRTQGLLLLLLGLVLMMAGGIVIASSEEPVRSAERSDGIDGGVSPARDQPMTSANPSLTPAVTGINGNPWGYNFDRGELIHNPPSDFCEYYFHCIPTFEDEGGYVVQCKDLQFSKSGGFPDSCSQDGGVKRPLYSPSNSPH